MGRALEQGHPYLAAVLSHVNKNIRGDTCRPRNTQKKIKPPWNSSFWVTYKPKFPNEADREGVKKMDRPARVPSRQCVPLIMPNIMLGAECIPDVNKTAKGKKNEVPGDKFKRMHAQREKAAKDRAFAKLNFPRFTKEQERLCDQLRDQYDQVYSSFGRRDKGVGGLQLMGMDAQNNKGQTRRAHPLNTGKMKVHTVHFCASPPELSKQIQKQINEPPDRSLQKFKTLRRRAPSIGGVNDRSRGDLSKRKAYEQTQSVLKQEICLLPTLVVDDPDGIPQEDAQLQELLKKRHEEIGRLTSAATEVNQEENMGQEE